MSANLALNRNAESMIAYTGETPWHKQGRKLPDNCTGVDMLQAAGLDWEVRASPIQAQVMTEQGDRVETMDGMQAIYRSDLGTILGLSSTRYEIFQNREMVSVLDSIAADNGITYEVAGGLGKGERVWILARIKDLDFSVAGDEMKSYLTIFSSHDGSSVVSIFPTTIRVVCANTWRMAVQQRQEAQGTHGRNTVKGGFSIKHTRNLKTMISQAAAAIKDTVEANKFSREMYAALASTPAPVETARDFFAFVAAGGKDEAASGRAATRRDNKMAEMLALSQAATNQTPAAAGTLWGVWNTVTEWVDHSAPVRDTQDRGEAASRFESAQFGAGADLKAAAWDRMVEVAGLAG